MKLLYICNNRRKKLNLNTVKNILGEKISICSKKELTQKTQCLSGCVLSFGYEKNIYLVIEQNIFKHDKIIFSPGIPEKYNSRNHA
ncbi:TPA: YbaK/EbsC family protein [Clostridioides difficile]